MLLDKPFCSMNHFSCLEMRKQAMKDKKRINPDKSIRWCIGQTENWSFHTFIKYGSYYAQK